MRDDRFLRALGDIDDSYVDGALEDIRPAPARPVKRIVILAACAAVLAATLLFAVPAMIKGRGTTPPAGTPLASESETNSGMEPLTDEPKQTDPRETEPTPPANTTHADPEPTNTVPVDPTPIGGSNQCKVHFTGGYHNLNYGYFKDYLSSVGVTEEEFLEWESSVSTVKEDNPSGCPIEDYNIKGLVEHFNIPRNIFEEICRNNPSCCYNPDAIYSNDPDAADSYYRDIESRIRDKEKMDDFAKLEKEIKNEFAKTSEERHIMTFGPDRVSILGLVKRFDVPRSFFEEYWAKQDKEYQESIPPFMPGDDPDDQPPEPIVRYDYDLDVLYDEDGTPKTYEDKTEYEIDAMFCGVEELFLGY